MTERFQSVGKCIYCGASETKLTDEHIVPYALSGQLILPASSCVPCAQITGAIIEKRVIGGLFDKIRSRHKIQSRRMKRRPTHSNIVVGEGNDSEIASIPISDLPGLSWTLPTFGPAGILFSARSDYQYPSNLQFQIGAADAEKLLAMGGGVRPVSITFGEYDKRMFLRMLAKIGHSFVFALLGDSFTPYLNNFILTGAGEGQFWIGTDDLEATPAENTLWSVDLGYLKDQAGTEHLCARIRFFGLLGTPAYIVVVGRSRVASMALPSPRGYAQAAFLRVASS